MPLSTPLPMHLASLAQAEEDEEAEQEGIEAGKIAVSNMDGGDLASALGLDAGSGNEDEADLDAERPDMPGLAQAPNDPDAQLQRLKGRGLAPTAVRVRG